MFILTCSDFPLVRLSAAVDLSPSSSDMTILVSRLTMNDEAESVHEHSRDSVSKRCDQIDKEKFVNWIHKHDINVSSAAEFLDMSDCPVSGRPTATLGGWYLGARPAAALKPGRRKKLTLREGVKVR
jgi:hypothetical protein